MAARLNRNHSELVLKRIQTSQLVNRLQDNAFGKIELTDGQIVCAKFLIERTLAKAMAPVDMNLHGNVTVLFDDPTQRPVANGHANGYHRKPVLTD
jgi:hypothetical protein